MMANKITIRGFDIQGLGFSIEPYLRDMENTVHTHVNWRTSRMLMCGVSAILPFQGLFGATSSVFIRTQFSLSKVFSLHL